MIDSILQRHDPRMFLVPERTLVGDGSSMASGRALDDLGCSPGPVAIVADASVLRLGSADAILESIRAHGYGAEVLAGVTGEPTVDDAREAVEAVRRVDPVAVVGIGGGSALDLAKFVALVAPRDEPVDAYFGVRDDVARRVKLVAIPTTAGTGSEATRIAMLSANKRKTIVNSAALVPDLVLLDPKLVMSLPGPVTASTGLDALCHAIEALLSTNRSPLSIADSRQGLRMVAQSLVRSFDRPEDIEARRGVLYGAHFAGRGLNAGVVLGHSVGYTIANRVTVAHGISCAIALPYCIRYARPVAEDTLTEIARDVTGHPDVDGLIAWIHDVNRTLGVPRDFVAVGISRESVADMAIECSEKYPRPNNPVPFEPGRLAAMYEAMAEGDLASAPFN
ncbi:MAG: iron-containing alcohol dehydrogenase [Bauldia sp.]|nr:iron-containing alcohol dehydrogenase [Bauldia sp.]